MLFWDAGEERRTPSCPRREYEQVFWSRSRAARPTVRKKNSRSLAQLGAARRAHAAWRSSRSLAQLTQLGAAWRRSLRRMVVISWAFGAVAAPFLWLEVVFRGSRPLAPWLAMWLGSRLCGLRRLGMRLPSSLGGRRLARSTLGGRRFPSSLGWRLRRWARRVTCSRGARS